MQKPEVDCLMTTKTGIDCIALKDQLQADMRRRYEGLSPEERRGRIREELEQSDSMLARKWRAIRDLQEGRNP